MIKIWLFVDPLWPFNYHRSSKLFLSKSLSWRVFSTCMSQCPLSHLKFQNCSPSLPSSKSKIFNQKGSLQIGGTRASQFSEIHFRDRQGGRSFVEHCMLINELKLCNHIHNQLRLLKKNAWNWIIRHIGNNI